MTIKEVNRKLDRLGIRQIDLAKEWKLPPSTVNKFLKRKFNSKRLDRLLAHDLGVSEETLRGEAVKEAAHG